MPEPETPQVWRVGDDLPDGMQIEAFVVLRGGKVKLMSTRDRESVESREQWEPGDVSTAEGGAVDVLQGEAFESREHFEQGKKVF